MTSIRLAVIASLLALPLHARAAKPQQPEPLVASSRPVAPRSGFRAELLSDLDDIQKKYLDLADAIPARKYAWRPGQGVRSISEVYMHVAGSNYLLATFIGVKPPAEIPKDFEKITTKERVLVELQHSFDRLREVILTTNDSDLEKTVMLYGNHATERQVLMTIENHLHEHLGQSIAYARVNGVVPPWSRKES
jgi:uncharacterized damage-inducible protein DinB